MEYEILAINPGSTSTKVSLYRNETCVFVDAMDHSSDDLSEFEEITDQLDFRTKVVESIMEKHSAKKDTLNAVVGRGGMLPFVHAGGYIVNDIMKKCLMEAPISEHASNLGALMADKIAVPLGIPALIYDCVGSNEFEDIARITGIPDIRRESLCHVLNQKAVGRKTAIKHGVKYEDLNMIIAHLGGGFSVGAHKKGRIVDCVRDDAGSYSPERSGSVPLLYVIDMCYSGNFTKKEMIRKIRGLGGLQALLGTKDCRKVEEMIAAGDKRAEQVYRAMAYQIAKSIGEMSSVLMGDVDYIVLTGGVAYSKMLTDLIAERIRFVAPVEVFPGEDEMEALSLGALRILRKQETAAQYTGGGPV